MTKPSRHLIIRLSSIDKEVLSAAAAMLGTSISTLVREASLGRANRVLAKSERKGGPSPQTFSRSQALIYLRSLAREARRGGYSRHVKVGFEVARFTPLLLGSRLDRVAALRQLQEHLRANDLPAVYAWYERVLPGVARRVPAWRQTEFSDGVRSAWASGDAMLRPVGRRASKGD